MIARVWRGWARMEVADAYDRHYRTEVLETLRETFPVSREHVCSGAWSTMKSSSSR
jgi:hypothetical protein